MKKTILSTLLGLGLASGAFAAGSYVENFDSYSVGGLSYTGQKSTTLTGAEVYGNNGAAASAVNIYSNNSPSWKALRMAQDGTQGPNATVATYVVGTVENPSTRVNSFTASFDLLLKNSTGAGMADRFSFNFGNLSGTSFPRDTEAGLWTPSQSGSMLSLVWDFYDNTPDYVGVQLFKNGSEFSSAFRVAHPVATATDLSGSFTRINVRYDEELNGGTFTFNKDGAVGSDNSITGGTTLLSVSGLGVTFAAGDKFAFSAGVGAESMDMFLDNVSINTVPEPSAGALLVLGLGSLIALRRTRRSAV